jgi:plastocyanin
MDGVPGLSQPPVLPGEDFTYEFVATNPGTRWYHSHVDSNAQLELGLYGPIIVEPREPGPTYDREFTYMLDEKALDFTPDVALGKAQLRNRDAGNGRGGLFQYDVFMFNGKAGDAIPPLTIAPGGRILVRLINAGSLPHAIHLHGHSFKVVATDGNPVPPAAQLLKDTVLVGPAERYDIEVEGTNPGVWMFHCHMPNHQDNGMMTALVYDGFELPAQHDHVALPSPSVDMHDHMPAAASASPQPASPSVVPPSTSSGPSAAKTAEILDNRYAPNPLTVPVGTTVSWINDGTNLHTVTSFNGSFDSGTLGAGQSWSYTFNTPGEYRFYCRQHLLNGMIGSIVVQ